MPARRTKRAAGRYIVNLTVEQLDGAKRRVYLYGRTQSEAKRKAQPPGSAFEQGAPLRDATRCVSDWLSEWRATFSRPATELPRPSTSTPGSACVMSTPSSVVPPRAGAPL